MDVDIESMITRNPTNANEHLQYDINVNNQGGENTPYYDYDNGVLHMYANGDDVTISIHTLTLKNG